MNTKVFKQAQEMVASNSAALLTGTAVVGTITTAVLTARASFKAARVIHNVESAPATLDVGGQELELDPVDSVERVKLVWPLFIPPALSGATTISAIVMSYRISTFKSAALAAAYGVTEKAFAEYKEKVLEQVTPKKASDIQDAVDLQKITDNPPPQTVVFGEGDMIALDAFSGHYFKTTPEKVRRAENDANAQIQTHNVYSLGDYYEALGIKQHDMSEHFIWTVDNPCSIEWSAQLDDTERPVLVITFVNAPKLERSDEYSKYL